MTDPIIKVHKLGKRYRIGTKIDPKGRDNFRDAILNTLKAPFKNFKRLRNLTNFEDGNTDTAKDIIWALKDVSFEINKGEVVGIIGRNGSGKSTLLKILSRITEPTEGYVELRGRVASLLEVGTGFHRELTGRENIYLNGSILGMKKWEIDARFDEIVAFSEIEKFLDTPVKHYSSGMYVRLAFAVAAHLEPEILLVDEVLAVGDAAFQKKCLGKMRDIARGGRTVLFVSHNMGAINRLCKRVIWLDKGRISLDGLSSETVTRYESQYLKNCVEWKQNNLNKVDSEFAFLNIFVKNIRGHLNSLFSWDESVVVEIRYLVKRRLEECQIGVRVYNSESIVVFSTSDADKSGVSALPKEVGLYHTTFTIPASFLAPGTYYILVAAHWPNRKIFELIEQAVVFEISPSGSLASLDGRLGVVTPLLPWETYKENS